MLHDKNASKGSGKGLQKNLKIDLRALDSKINVINDEANVPERQIIGY